MIKLIKEYDLSDQYKGKPDLKKQRVSHRLYSETVKLLYDDSIALGISMGAGKANKKT